MGSVRWLWLAVAVMALCAICGCKVGSSAGAAVASPVDNGAIADNSVAGTVTIRGTPVAGATVTLFMTNNNTIAQTATTDANGNYSFSGLSATGDVAGEYQIWVQKAGYGFYPALGAGGAASTAKAMRWDYTGQFEGNGLTDTGIYFTVIDYVSRPGAPLTGANFTAYDGSNPLVRLAATGQRASYADGDDGSEAKGVAWGAGLGGASGAARFTDNGDGSVTDTVTGLVWLKDAGCLAAGTWAAAIAEANGLAAGACGLNDGSKAGDWRLPNLNELASVVDVSAAQPALTVGHPFLRVSTGMYWTSTSYFGGALGSPNAWAIRMGDGAYVNDGIENLKIAGNSVWAVRGAGGGLVKLAATGYYDEPSQQVAGDDGAIRAGVGLTYPRWIDNGNGTVTDTVTGLRWMKEANCIADTWANAVAEIGTLGNGQCGLTDGSAPGDWRMPNRNGKPRGSHERQRGRRDGRDVCVEE
ncbi:MAG TPA: DUF1566 domain-containing protein [Acidobacteriaceae bacterium]|jgi:hypothetical protein|nr:DUF1566 domain-containing protein [Acidobacteriaceae bacterium]